MEFEFNGLLPQVAETAFVAPTAVLIGEVVLEPESSVWFGAVLRGDEGRIVVGRGTCVQDNAVIHGETTIGENCVLGHTTIVHHGRIGDRVLVANGAIVHNGSEIGDDAIVGMATLVTQGTRVPPQTLMLGVPARPSGTISEEQLRMKTRVAQTYQDRARQYRNDNCFRPAPRP